MPSADLWDDKPALRDEKRPVAGRPPYWWDEDPSGANCALRHQDGRVLLTIVPQGDSWGIYQLQVCGQAVFVANSAAEWELVQIRGTRDQARECAIEMARRVGLL